MSDDQIVKKGSNVTFSCNVTAANPFTTIVAWKSQTNKSIQHSNGVVMMSSVDQGGRYTCHANNSAGESQRLFTLTVGEYITNVKHYPLRPKIAYIFWMARMVDCSYDLERIDFSFKDFFFYQSKFKKNNNLIQILWHLSPRRTQGHLVLTTNATYNFLPNINGKLR